MTQIDRYFEEFGVARQSLEARGFRRFAEADSLDLAEVGEDGREHWLAPAAARAWRELKQAAAHADTQIFIVSAFRSVERQAAIVRAKLEAGQAIQDILSVSAFPGYSEHHTGLALDLASPGVPLLEIEFEHCAAFRWLMRHAASFGFLLSYPPGNACGYQYEPWHWCFNDAAGGD
jgi:D-alanyl-D-alanine carboxypeptidase